MGARVNWTEHAACKGQTQRMFPGVGGDRSMRYALSLCAQCSVIDQCREATKDETWGVYAGELRTYEPWRHTR